MKYRFPKEYIKKESTKNCKNPYHYFRIDRNQGPQDKYDRMIVGGEDNREEAEFNKQKNFNALKDYLKNTFGAQDYAITRKWNGPIMEPSDGLALIGEFKPQQLLATAFSGNGMTYSLIAATIFKDIVLGKKNSLIKIYDPTRVPTVENKY